MLHITSVVLSYTSARPPARPRASAPQMSASLSDPIIAALSRQGYGRVRSVTDVTNASPGASSTHMRYDTDEGPVFCKRSPLPPEVFASEAASLRVMRAAALAGGYLRVPEALGSGSLPLGGSYLLLEWIEQPQALGTSPATKEELGYGLAALHSAPQPPPRRGFGFECDTHLGRWRQDNRWVALHSDFFVARRLRPQLEALQAAGGARSEQLYTVGRLQERALEAADVLLRDLADPPALLHGDLWMGTVGANERQQPVLYGAACWYGLPEFDLATSAAWGSLGSAFYDAYHAQRPRSSGFEERQDLYTLYHYLSHLNLEAVGYGHRGAVEEPRVYYERVCELMRRVIAAAAV